MKQPRFTEIICTKALINNTLKNRKRYKYIPCCFKSDQTKRKGPYLEYFKGEIVEKGPQQNIIITNKVYRI